MKNNLNKYINLNDKEYLLAFVKQVTSIRETKNITQDEVAELLNINKNIIINLENGDVDKLENNVFTLGHIKTYLKWLNIEYNIFLEKIDSNVQKIKPINNKKFINRFVYLLSFKYGKNNLLFVVIFLSILLSTIIINLWNNINDKKIKNIYNVNLTNENIQKHIVDKKINLETDLEDKIDLNENNNDIKDEVTLETANNKIDNITSFKIYAKNDSWIEIQDENSKIIISKILKKDELVTIEYKKGLKLVTGNAGGINIEINDIFIKNIGKDGEVKRNISLDYKDLLKFNE